MNTIVTSVNLLNARYSSFIYIYCSSTLLIFTLSGKINAQDFAQAVVSNKLISDSKILNSVRRNGLNFTPNKGQIVDMNGKACPDILYKGDASLPLRGLGNGRLGGSANIYIRKTGISYVYTNMGEVQREVRERVEAMEHSTEGLGNKTESEWEQKLIQKAKIKIQRVDMDFANCNKNANAINEDEVEVEVDGYNNYYYAHCSNGILNAKPYNKVTSKNIYKGIDVTYCGDKTNGIKYDIIVNPHADPVQVKLHWKGAKELIIKHITDGKYSTKSS